MTYFRHDGTLTVGASVELAGEEAQHLLRARRIRNGERFALQDAQGSRFEAELVRSDRRSAQADIVREIPVPALPSRTVALLQAAVKDKAADWIIEKCTELGVSQIAFFPGAYSTVAVESLESPKQRTRWERIAWEACKQCDRQFPPEIVIYRSLAATLAEYGVDAPLGREGWVLHPSQTPLPQVRTGSVPGSVYVLVGPEGGLNPEEVRAAEDVGYSTRMLGATVLRSETAAIAACALALYGHPAS